MFFAIFSIRLRNLFPLSLIPFSWVKSQLQSLNILSHKLSVHFDESTVPYTNI